MGTAAEGEGAVSDCAEKRIDRAMSAIRIAGLTAEEVYELPQRNRAERRRRAALMLRLAREFNKIQEAAT